MSARVKRVLAVDDDPYILEAIKIILETNGYQATTIRNGSKTLKLAQDLQPDLILLDILLMGQDGRDICRRLKALPKTSQIPVILVSAITVGASNFHSCGAVDYIEKPFDLHHLLTRIAVFV
jgi:DNA-binding response OmpR family regulator